MLVTGLGLFDALGTCHDCEIHLVKSRLRSIRRMRSSGLQLPFWSRGWGTLHISCLAKALPKIWPFYALPAFAESETDVTLKSCRETGLSPLVERRFRFKG